MTDMVTLNSFTKPGEVTFNLVAAIQLVALLFFLALASQEPKTFVDWSFWMIVLGPLGFWMAVITILIRLIRSGYKPRFRFKSRLSITGSRNCYEAYVKRWGRDLWIWMVPGAAIWSFLSFFLMVVFSANLEP